MDNANHSINIYDIGFDDGRTTDEIVTELGYNPEECSIMWCSQLKINFL